MQTLGIETFQRELEVDLWDLVARYAVLVRAVLALVDVEGEEGVREMLGTVGFTNLSP